MIFLYSFALFVGLVHSETPRSNDICLFNNLLAETLQLAYENLDQFREFKCHDDTIQNGSFSFLSNVMMHVSSGLSTEEPPYIYEQLYTEQVLIAKNSTVYRPAYVNAAVVLAMIDFLRSAIDQRSEAVYRLCCSNDIKDCYKNLKADDDDKEMNCPGYSNHVKLHTTSMNIAVYLNSLVNDLLDGAKEGSPAALINYLVNNEAHFKEALIVLSEGYKDLTTYPLPCLQLELNIRA